MCPQADTYEPLRGWDELLDDAVARGTRLRRRRLAWRTLPVVAAVCATIPFLLPGGSSGHSMQVLTTDLRPTPATVTPHRSLVVRPGATGAVAAPRRTGTTVSAAARNDVTTYRATPSRRAVRAWPELTYTDPSDDAVGATGLAGTQSTDITRMTFRATADGLVVSMGLRGYQDADHHYLAVLHSARSGCDLQVRLDYAAPSASAVCNGATVWSRNLSPYDDPTHVELTLTWDAFPSQVSPHDRLTTSGQVVVSEATGGSHVVNDSASDGRSVRFR